MMTSTRQTGGRRRRQPEQQSVPAPVRATIVRLSLCVAAVAVFGIVWSAVTRDRMLLLLSCAAAAAGTLRILPMIRCARKGEYRVLECTVLGESRSALRSRNRVRVALPDGTELTLSLGGRSPLRPGSSYRLYLTGAGGSGETSVPEYMRGAETLLGFEPARGSGPGANAQ